MNQKGLVFDLLQDQKPTLFGSFISFEHLTKSNKG